MTRERLYLYDTTLRDGAQTQGVDFSLEDKGLIAQQLDVLGIDHAAIVDLVETTLAANPGLTTSQRGNVDDVLAIDAEARASARSLLARFASAARAG